METYFIDKITREISKQFHEKLEEHIKSFLKKLGYEFREKEFINFCIERVHITVQDGKHTFYLDYVDTDNKGTVIGGYYAPKANFSMEGFTAKSSIDYKFF